MQIKNSMSQSWLKKAGWLGFTFFFVKGMVWLAVGFTAFNLFD